MNELVVSGLFFVFLGSVIYLGRRRTAGYYARLSGENSSLHQHMLKAVPWTALALVMAGIALLVYGLCST